MSRRPILASVLVLLAAGTTLVLAKPQQPTFRSSTSVVTVDVLVRDGSKPVRGLAKGDFQIFDEGVPQQIDELLVEQMPIDLTILLDASGSTARAIETFKKSATQVSGMLRSQDRVRVMAFATGTVEVAPLAASLHADAFATQIPSGATSLNDALVLVLSRLRSPGRRHLVVAYTDGVDTSSVLEPVMVSRVARHSDVVLHLVLAAEGRLQANARRTLREAAESTGGGISESSSDAAETLRRLFDDFRASYVLRYRPAQVPSGGWHGVTVRLTGSDADRYTVQARKGYAGGGS